MWRRSRPTFGKYAEEVISRRQADGKSKATTGLYRRLMRLYLEERFGDVPLGQITVRQVNRRIQPDAACSVEHGPPTKGGNAVAPSRNGFVRPWDIYASRCVRAQAG